MQLAYISDGCFQSQHQRCFSDSVETICIVEFQCWNSKHCHWNMWLNQFLFLLAIVLTALCNPCLCFAVLGHQRDAFVYLTDHHCKRKLYEIKWEVTNASLSPIVWQIEPPLRAGCLTSMEATNPLLPKHWHWLLTWVHESIQLSILTQVQMWDAEHIKMTTNKQLHLIKTTRRLTHRCTQHAHSWQHWHTYNLTFLPLLASKTNENPQ